MKETLFALLAAFLGSLGFGMLQNTHGKKLLIASVGGMGAWGVYLMVSALTPELYMRYGAASIFAALYAEIFSRVLKTPTTVLLGTAVIPLIPGGGLYYTMEYALRGDAARFAQQGMETLLAAASIAGGILAVSSVIRSAMLLLRERAARGTRT